MPVMLLGSRRYKACLISLQKAREAWNRLGLDDVINRACEIDLVAEAVLEFRLPLTDLD